MNLKNVTKTGLNDFISRKVSEQKKETHAEIDNLINAKLNIALQNYIDVKKVEDAAAKFADLLQETLDKYKKPLGSWKYHNTLQNVNSYCLSIGLRIKDEVKEKMIEYIQNPLKGVYDFDNEELNKTLKELQESAKPLYTRIAELVKLQQEIERVIKNEPNGGRGYKALVALGVDMEGYEETGVNLPAIVKLSVDVCVLNGDCEKKVSA